MKNRQLTVNCKEQIYDAFFHVDPKKNVCISLEIYICLQQQWQQQHRQQQSFLNSFACVGFVVIVKRWVYIAISNAFILMVDSNGHLARYTLQNVIHQHITCQCMWREKKRMKCDDVWRHRHIVGLLLQFHFNFIFRYTFQIHIILSSRSSRILLLITQCLWHSNDFSHSGVEHICSLSFCLLDFFFIVHNLCIAIAIAHSFRFLWFKISNIFYDTQTSPPLCHMKTNGNATNDGIYCVHLTFLC